MIGVVVLLARRSRACTPSAVDDALDELRGRLAASSRLVDRLGRRVGAASAETVASTRAGV